MKRVEVAVRRLPDNRLDRALDETARTAARLIRSTADPTYTAARFLLLFADSLQDRPASPASQHVFSAAKLIGTRNSGN